MRPGDKDRGLLGDMLQACRDTQMICKDSDWEDFLDDRKLQLAVERCLEIVGEAAGKVTDGFQEVNPQIPWRNLKGMRNILAHDYGQIDHELVYETAVERVPELLRILERSHPEEPSLQAAAWTCRVAFSHKPPHRIHQRHLLRRRAADAHDDQHWRTALESIHRDELVIHI